MSDHTLDELVSAIRDHSGMDLAQIIEAGEHGADSGWPEFSYTSDAARFTAENRELVWSLLAEDADSCGAENVAAFVGTFSRSDMAETPDGFDALLAWYGLEAAGRYLADTREEREQGERERIAVRGYRDGLGAGSWATDGNTSRETFAALLARIESGDPQVMDELPVPRVGGEWAGESTWSDVLADESCEDSDDGRTDLLDVYEDQFSQGVMDEVTRACRIALAEDGDELNAALRRQHERGY